MKREMPVMDVAGELKVVVMSIVNAWATVVLIAGVKPEGLACASIANVARRQNVVTATHPKVLRITELLKTRPSFHFLAPIKSIGTDERWRIDSCVCRPSRGQAKGNSRPCSKRRQSSAPVSTPSAPRSFGATLILILIGALVVAHSERRKLVAAKTRAARGRSS